MKLIFIYPAGIENLELFLATHAYEDIWNQDGSRIIKQMCHYTHLDFLQPEIEVLVHDGQSMSGMKGVPMRLSVHNTSLFEKRNALIHELSHRLLFGNNKYAPQDTPEDNDEIRTLLFQGDVLYDLYGQVAYDSWSKLGPLQHTEDYIQDLRYVLSLSREQRHEKLHSLLST